MNRFIKYQSNEAGNFTASRNNVTFNIPASDYNFADSYVELSISVDGETYAAEAHAGCLSLFRTLGRGNDKRSVRNETLVRRVRFSTQDQMLEDIDRVDLLRQTLGTYTTDPVEKLGESYKSLSQPVQFGQMSTVFRDVYTLGGAEHDASAVEAKIQIPLKDLIELGKESEMPLSQLGSSRLELFLELGNINLDPRQVDIIGPEGGFNPITIQTAEHTAAAGDGPTVTTISIPDTYFSQTEEYQTFPLYVGQAVECVAATDPAPGASAVVRPNNKIISLVRAGNQINITFLESIFTALTDTESAAIVIAPAAPEALPTAKIKQAAIVLSEYTQPLGKVDEIRYSTYTTELMSEGGDNMYRQTLVEPTAFNIFLCDASTLPFSTGANWATYRLSVNNTPILDRLADVSVAQRNGEHYELIGRALANGGMPFNNILEADYNMDALAQGIEEAEPAIATWTSTNTSTVKMIAAPVPITANMKPVLIELNGIDALGNLALYKQVVRSVKL